MSISKLTTEICCFGIPCSKKQSGHKRFLLWESRYSIYFYGWSEHVITFFCYCWNICWIFWSFSLIFFSFSIIFFSFSFILCSIWTTIAKFCLIWKTLWTDEQSPQLIWSLGFNSSICCLRHCRQTRWPQLRWYCTRCFPLTIYSASPSFFYFFFSLLFCLLHKKHSYSDNILDFLIRFSSIPLLFSSN